MLPPAPKPICTVLLEPFVSVAQVNFSLLLGLRLARGGWGGELFFLFFFNDYVGKRPLVFPNRDTVRTRGYRHVSLRVRTL
jgi:hypothetical protein